jgi:NhaP-type Na+/H+ or K+/H+ antiporter
VASALILGAAAMALTFPGGLEVIDWRSVIILSVYGGICRSVFAGQVRSITFVDLVFRIDTQSHANSEDLERQS